MKIERELMRGAGPVAVLRLLQAGEMYGYELAEALAQRSDGLLAMGHSTLYPLLYNLEGKGHIEAHWTTAESGRRRKYYRLTDAGRRRLAESTEQWRTLARAMTGLGILQPTGGSA
ncbi:MAG: helix-turn-helix transcriptional regulator [Planctomycetota bacterium]